MKNILLIGMPGSGKSTVGEALAKELGIAFTDTDRVIEQTYDAPLSKLVESCGFDGFIAREGAVGEAINVKDTVIATGGSMVFSDGAMRHLKENAVTVWIDVPLRYLRVRLGHTMKSRGVATDRPMTLEEIDRVRRPLYEKYADVKILSSRYCKDTVEEIKKALEAYL